MDEFAREWTYRDPMVTVTYPKGWTGLLPAARRKAAERDGALAVEAPATEADATEPEKPSANRRQRAKKSAE